MKETDAESDVFFAWARVSNILPLLSANNFNMEDSISNSCLFIAALWTTNSDFFSANSGISNSTCGASKVQVGLQFEVLLSGYGLSAVVAEFEAWPRRSRDAGTRGSVQIHARRRQAPLLLHLVEPIPDLLRDRIAGLLHHQSYLRGASKSKKKPPTAS